MTLRGNNAFARPIRPPVASYPVDSHVNDIFLHALFARLTLSNNETIEFQTQFDKTTGTIELAIPTASLPIFNQLTGLQRGPQLQTFVNWLIGSSQLAAASDLDKDFVPSSNIDIWIGATRTSDGDSLVINLPLVTQSIIGHNLKVSSTHTAGPIRVYLVWKHTCGDQTEFSIRTDAHVVATSGDFEDHSTITTISTFNLIVGDIRESLIMELDSVDPDDIISLLISRNFQDSEDPQTECVGVMGLRLEFGD